MADLPSVLPLLGAIPCKVLGQYAHFHGVMTRIGPVSPPFHFQFPLELYSFYIEVRSGPIPVRVRADRGGVPPGKIAAPSSRHGAGASRQEREGGVGVVRGGAGFYISPSPHLIPYKTPITCQNMGGLSCT